MKLHTLRNFILSQNLQRLLAVLENGPMEVQDAAGLLNLTSAGARNYLNKLVDSGLVQRKHRYGYRAKTLMYEIVDNPQRLIALRATLAPPIKQTINFRLLLSELERHSVTVRDAAALTGMAPAAARKQLEILSMAGLVKENRAEGTCGRRGVPVIYSETADQALKEKFFQIVGTPSFKQDETSGQACALNAFDQPILRKRDPLVTAVFGEVNPKAT